MTAAITRRDFLLSLLGTLSLVAFEACSAPADPSSFRALLFRDRVLDKGRTVNLDGWLLSVTEVRLWCLYLLAMP